MKKKLSLSFLFILSALPPLRAQDLNSDSTAVAKVFEELVNICKNVDFSDPLASRLGFFYKAAPFIIYRGDDKKRVWKDFANYEKMDEKTGVDEICEKINRTVNQDSTFKIVQYLTETESEGTWHILIVAYTKKGVEKKNAFAFLKIGKRFALGDID